LQYLSRKPISFLPQEPKELNYTQKLKKELFTITNDMKLIKEGKKPVMTKADVRKMFIHQIKRKKKRMIANDRPTQDEEGRSKSIYVKGKDKKCLVELDLTNKGFTCFNTYTSTSQNKLRKLYKNTYSKGRHISNNLTEEESEIKRIDQFQVKELLKTNYIKTKNVQKKQRIQLLNMIKNQKIKPHKATFGQTPSADLTPITYTRKSIKMLLDANSTRYFDSYKEFLHEYHNTVIAALIAPSDRLKFRGKPL
jgi:hypothetical protein